MRLKIGKILALKYARSSRSPPAHCSRARTTAGYKQSLGDLALASRGLRRLYEFTQAVLDRRVGDERGLTLNQLQGLLANSRVLSDE